MQTLHLLFSAVLVSRPPQSFRWAPPRKGGCIEWDAFLRLLEGDETNLSAPMNSYSKHIKITSDIPFFATSIAQFRWWKNESEEPQIDHHKKENEMMRSRWHVIELAYVFKEEDKIKDVPKCVGLHKVDYVGV